MFERASDVGRLAAPETLAFAVDAVLVVLAVLVLVARAPGQATAVRAASARAALGVVLTGRALVLLADLAAAAVRVRLTGLVAEHAFPPAEYMLRKYGSRRRAVLPLLYLRRGAQGLFKALQ